MAKIVIQHGADPSIGIVLEPMLMGGDGRSRGWRGTCTECGWPMHRWSLTFAINGAQQHVNRHESSL